MPDAREIYALHAEQYDALVRCEDHQGNLLKAIREVVTLEGCEVVELGAGTGRVTALLAPHVRSLRAFDLEPAMLELARRKLSELGLRNWQLGVADNARLPVADASADLALAGWSYGHQTVWHPDSWRAPIEAALQEMTRVLRPSGTALVIETLGTGHSEPFMPPEQLGRYYRLLTEEFHFEQRWIRTDYEFASVADGERLVRFFFGAEFARDFLARGSTSLPECTGVWCWRKPASASSSFRRGEGSPPGPRARPSAWRDRQRPAPAARAAVVRSGGGQNGPSSTRRRSGGPPRPATRASGATLPRAHTWGSS